MNFPIEILYIILNYVNINEIIRTCIALVPGISQDQLHRIVMHRKSILRYLEPISSNPPELLNTMRKTSSFLIGPRALNYFRPLNGIEHTPWSFVCQPHILSNYRLVQYFKSLGIHWKAIQTEDVQLSAQSYTQPTILLKSCLEGTLWINGEVNTIRILWASTYRSHGHEPLEAISPIKYLLLLDLNISQCMISYLGALAMNKSHTFGNTAIRIQSCISNIEDDDIYCNNGISISDTQIDRCTLGKAALCSDNSIYVSLDKYYKISAGPFRQVSLGGRDLTWFSRFTPNGLMPNHVSFRGGVSLPLSKSPKSVDEMRIVESIQKAVDSGLTIGTYLGVELDRLTVSILVREIKRDSSLSIPF